MSEAVLIIGHGSSEVGRGSAPAYHAEHFTMQTGIPAYHAYLCTEPGVEEVLRRIAADGVDGLTVFPLFYMPGFLTRAQVPKALGLPEGSTGGTVTVDGHCISVKITGPFGDHWKMKSVLKNLIDGEDAVPSRTSILMISHGSKEPTDGPDPNAELLRSWGFEVEEAYNEFRSPTVEEGLAHLIGADGKDILAIPMFVSPSDHTVTEIPMKLGMEGYGKKDLGNERTLTYVGEIGMRSDVTYIVIDRAEHYGEL